MNPYTYPLQAVALGPDGTPWYPFRSPDTDAVLYARDWHLPIVTAVWATVPDEFADRPRIRLDEPHLAELVYFAYQPGNTFAAIDPDQVTADSLMPLLTGVLTACRCDPGALDAWLVDQYESGHYRIRLDRCRAAVHRLLSAV